MKSQNFSQTLLTILGTLMFSASHAGAITELFFSEYVEGSSFNKAVEIYNGTAANIDLSAYSYRAYHNGSTTPNYTVNLSGALAAGDVFVLVNSGANSAFLGIADMTSTNVSFNGDDAIALAKNGALIDVIGQIGFDPGSAWTGAGINMSTANATLRRKSDVLSGDKNGFDIFDPSVEWISYASNTFSGLGQHNVHLNIPLPSTLAIIALGLLGMSSRKTR